MRTLLFPGHETSLKPHIWITKRLNFATTCVCVCVCVCIRRCPHRCCLSPCHAGKSGRPTSALSVTWSARQSGIMGPARWNARAYVHTFLLACAPASCTSSLNYLPCCIYILTPISNHQLQKPKLKISNPKLGATTPHRPQSAASLFSRPGSAFSVASGAHEQKIARVDNVSLAFEKLHCILTYACMPICARAFLLARTHTRMHTSQT